MWSYPCDWPRWIAQTGNPASAKHSSALGFPREGDTGRANSLAANSNAEPWRALVNRPAILFADEPTGNLDSANGEQILLLLHEIQQSLGMTIIMVTHERPLAERFANRIALLSDGRLVSDGAQR